MKNYRVVKSSYFKNYNYFPVTREQYFYITINKIDYILNKDVMVFTENNKSYVIVNENKIFLMFK